MIELPGTEDFDQSCDSIFQMTFNHVCVTRNKLGQDRSYTIYKEECKRNKPFQIVDEPKVAAAAQTVFKILDSMPEAGKKFDIFSHGTHHSDEDVNKNLAVSIVAVEWQADKSIKIKLRELQLPGPKREVEAEGDAKPDVLSDETHELSYDHRHSEKLSKFAGF